MFTPSPDPMVVFLPPHAQQMLSPGRLGGPMAKLIDLDAISSGPAEHE
jgi:hypothetical protein